jgi:hypothetical protein
MIKIENSDFSKESNSTKVADNKVLQNAGSISHLQALEKVTIEYEKFKAKTKKRCTNKILFVHPWFLKNYFFFFGCTNFISSTNLVAPANLSTIKST